MEKKQSVFHALSAINVKSKVKKKNNLNYLSWSDAWAMLKEKYPTAQRHIYEHDATGFNYFTDGRTAWVKVGIDVDGLEHIDMLPVMDFRNQSISCEKMTSMDVNKAIQRSTVKAMGMHGLGIAVYQGEDLPDVVAVVTKPEVLPSLTMKGSKWVDAVKFFTDNHHKEVADLFKQVERSYVLPPRIKGELKKIHESAGNESV